MESKKPVEVVFPNEIECRVFEDLKYVGLKFSRLKNDPPFTENHQHPFHALTAEMAEDVILSLIDYLNRLDGKSRRLKLDNL